jgi:DNA-binding NtrC family response regulator
MDKPIKILAVDDEQVVLDSLQKHLKHVDCELECVLSVPDAINELGRQRYDIVVTDLMMPRIDGLEFMKELQARHPGVTVIVITGYATINTAIKAKELGAFDYIAKPFSKQELLEVIHRAIDHVRPSGDES